MTFSRLSPAAASALCRLCVLCLLCALFDFHHPAAREPAFRLEENRALLP